MRLLLLYITIALCVICLVPTAFGKADSSTSDSLPASRLRLDSGMMERTPLNPVTVDSGKKLPPHIVRTQADLAAVVDFSARDSVILVGRDKAYMYGDGKVSYGKVKLDAANIDMDMATSQVYAIGATDSAGDVTGQPVFNDAGTDYKSKTMRYNFKTGKGYITDVITQQGEGYLTGGVTKKIDEHTFYLQNGRYTTCNHHDDPDFWLQLTKAKVTPKKNIVSGPAYMVLAGLPLPLAVPFGYFPFSDKYSSGILMPTFGDDYNKGFYLRNGGYYLALSDYMDLRLLGEIYTNGTWGVNAVSKYVKRYKYSGNFDLSYRSAVTGEKGFPDYSKQNEFNIRWTHNQDAKANPNLTLSASVDYRTVGYDRSGVDSYFSQQMTENTTSSSVSLGYRIPNSLWNLNTSANVSQRNRDSTLTVSFPNLTVSMSQTNPFKRQRAVGEERWYEKIRLSYTGEFTNALTARQDVFFKKSLIKDWRNGIRHNVPVTATFNAFKYFNITPSINMNDVMYSNYTRQYWNPGTQQAVADTVYGFYNLFSFNTSVALSTKVYGFFQPARWAGGNKVSMIRHVLTPTVSFTAAPDFSDPMWGMWGTYNKIDSRGNITPVQYSFFQNNVYGGGPSPGKQGSVNLTLNNNVEMKLRAQNDSVKERKISLIEGLSLSQGYNFAAKERQWSNLAANLTLRLVKDFNFSVNSTWDPYFYKANASGYPVLQKQTRLQAGKGYARLSSASTSFSYTFNNNTFRKKYSSSKNNKNNNNSGANSFDGTNPFDPDDEGSNKEEGEDEHPIKLNPDGYMQWAFPWSLSINYSMGLSNGMFDPVKEEYKLKFNQNLTFSGNVRPTDKWAFSMSGNYNFDTKKISYLSCNLSRDLHCFTMTANFIPLGPYKSYNFHIAVTSSLLSDLKYDKRSSASNGITWY